MSEKIKKIFPKLADLIGIDPQKTYMGGGYKRENLNIHDIVIEDNTIRAYCDVTNDYSEGKYFHLTQPAAYSCSVQLIIGYFAHSRNIGRRAKGFHIFLYDYSTRWNKIIKNPNKIPIKVTEIETDLKKRVERTKFSVSIGENDSLVSSYTIIFRLPTS